jgi:hypothetical protein
MYFYEKLVSSPYDPPNNPNQGKPSEQMEKHRVIGSVEVLTSVTSFETGRESLIRVTLLFETKTRVETYKVRGHNGKQHAAEQ